jgi:hypothetical protein
MPPIIFCKSLLDPPDFFSGASRGGLEKAPEGCLVDDLFLRVSMAEMTSLT